MLFPVIAAIAAASSPVVGGSAALPIGRLIWAAHRGTAFLVGPCEAVSAKHVAPVGRGQVGARTKVWMGGQLIGATVTAIGAHPAPNRPGAARDGDWMLVHLDSCIGQRLGYFRLLREPLLTSSYFHSAEAVLAGFPDGGRALTESAGCRAWAILPDGTIQLSCATRPGQSGGPVFVRDAAGQLTAIAIVSAGGDSRFSFAASVGDLAAIVDSSVAR